MFTEEPLAGNPLAVFPEADGLSHNVMQSLAREMNLSETSFVVPPTEAGRAQGADYRMRIFTPGIELPFAGHPSIGTAWVLATEGRLLLEAPTTVVHQELAIGVLPLVLSLAQAADDDDESAPTLRTVTMTQGEAELVHILDSEERDELAEALEVPTRHMGWKLEGPTANARTAPPAVISTGLPFLVVPIRDLEVLSEIDRERSTAVANFAEAYGCDSLALIASGNAGAIGDADVHARVLSHPRQGIGEDPATGAAAGPIAVYLGRLHRTRGGTQRAVIEQGVEVDRPSRLVAEADFDADGHPLEVRVSGAAVPVIEGWVTLP